MKSMLAIAAALLVAESAAAQVGAPTRWRTPARLPGSRASAFLNLLGNNAAIRYQGIVRPQIDSDAASRDQRQTLDRLAGAGSDGLGGGFGNQGQGGLGGPSPFGGFGGPGRGAAEGYSTGYYGDADGSGIAEPFAGSGSRRLYSSGSFAAQNRGIRPPDMGVKARFLDRSRFYPLLRTERR